MAKFKVGDRARFISLADDSVRGETPIGSEVRIVRLSCVCINLYGKEVVTDYGYSYDGVVYGCDEWQLEPILGSWDEIEKVTGWKREADLVI